MLTEIIKSHLLEEDKNHREKTSFWASEAETNVFDIYHRWMGTPPTNPIEPEKLVMFQAAKMIEVALVDRIKKSTTFLVPIDSSQHRVEMEREGVPVTGYIDAVIEENNVKVPIEVKTIYGDYQARELTACKPKTSYLKQLAIYMDFLDVDRGILFYMDRGTGNTWEFELKRNGTVFTCFSISFDITDVYKRWARLYRNNIIPKIEPKSEFKYKYELEKLKEASKASISDARMNRAVYGDWQVKYSPYKNLIIEREGCGLGYSDEELKIIKEITKGYSSKV